MCPNDYSTTPCVCKSGVKLSVILQLKYLDNMSGRQKMDEGRWRPKLRLTKVSRRNCVINGQTAPTCSGFVGFVFKQNLIAANFLICFWRTAALLNCLGTLAPGCKGCNVTAVLESSYQTIHPIVTELDKFGRKLSCIAPWFERSSVLCSLHKTQRRDFSRADLISILLPTTPSVLPISPSNFLLVGRSWSSLRCILGLVSKAHLISILLPTSPSNFPSSPKLPPCGQIVNHLAGRLHHQLPPALRLYMYMCSKTEF